LLCEEQRICGRQNFSSSSHSELLVSASQENTALIQEKNGSNIFGYKPTERSELACGNQTSTLIFLNHCLAA
jgi:hypothetical protein